MERVTTVTNSPLGALRIEVSLRGELHSLQICDSEEPVINDDNVRFDLEPGLRLAAKQLELFFQGRLQLFELPIDFSDYSQFAMNVLQTLQTVPFGTTVSYGELAAMAGHPGAARAVGRVVGANRTPILIPCHRVVGSKGDLVGYSATGGLVTKRWLLDFEQQVLSNSC